MSASITGLGSGFDIDSWVSQLVAVKQSSTVTPLQTKLSNLQTKNSAVSNLKNKYSTLQSSLQTFTRTIYNSSSDMWAKTTIDSSNSAYATASSSGSVAASKVELKIDQIATATVASSADSLGAISNDSIRDTLFTNLANGQAKSGTFSMFVDRKQYTIDISDNDTVENVIDKISEKTNGKVEAEVDEYGYFTIKATSEGSKLTLGAGNDESNLVNALKLHTSINEGAGFKSNYAISTVKTSASFSSAESGLGVIDFNEDGEGKIKINGVEFAVNKDMDLNTLISKINGNSEAGVKASYDALSNKVILSATQTGNSNIALSEEDTNLLQILKLTETNEQNEEVLARDSQKLGTNAMLTINGNDVVSSSNTITGESSGIANLSITIKKPTENSNDKDAVNSVTLDIQPDYSAVKDALKTFVNAYNDVVTTTKTLTSSDGALAHEASLNSILSQVRSITSMLGENDGAYSMLAEIGISTSKTDTTQLSIDDSKLTKVLRENFDSVKQLLSDGYVSQNDNGLFDRMLSNVNSILDYQNGYFTSKSDSINSQITQLNTRIERANTRLSNYETRITKQFNQMDSIISALTSQLSTFQAYIG